MDFTQIRYEVNDAVALMTLNRPERLNAWTEQMKDEMIAAADMADADDAVRVLVVTGAGSAFCAGADLDPETFASRRAEAQASPRAPRDRAGQLTLKFYGIRKPIIAAINGPAVGIGATMTLAMDIRLASEQARFGFVFNRRGMVPEGCSTWFLPRLVGFGQAAEWIYTGRVFSAEEALAGRLVSRVVPAEELLPAANELAREIACHTSAVSTALARRMLWDMLGAGHPMEAHRVESKCFHYMFGSADLAEGVGAFLEKRPPRFTMRPSVDMPDFYPWRTEPPYEEG
ncbi:MAG: enoyl-CoA hydratase-related protein [Syntrophales bacterium]